MIIKFVAVGLNFNTMRWRERRTLIMLVDTCRNKRFQKRKTFSFQFRSLKRIVQFFLIQKLEKNYTVFFNCLEIFRKTSRKS